MKILLNCILDGSNHKPGWFPYKPAPHEYLLQYEKVVELGSDKFRRRILVYPVLGQCCHRD